MAHRRLRVAMIALSLVAGLSGAVNQAAVAKAPTSAPAGRPVLDWSFTFDVFRITCGSGKAGDGDSLLNPDGLFCAVAIGVVNGGPKRKLDPYTHYLVVDRRKYATSRRAMLALTLDDPHNVFSRPIPHGGGGLGALFFEIPRGSAPTALQMHERSGTKAAIAIFERCSWSDNGGGCKIARDNGEPGNAYPREAHIGMHYPHALQLDQPTCFAAMEWRASPAAMRTTFGARD